MYSTKSLIISIVIAFLIGLGAGLLLFRTDEPVAEPMPRLEEEVVLDETAREKNTLEIPVIENSVAVFDQPAGSSVKVLLVSLIRDGWVVVYEDRNGAPGNILGAQRFVAGSHPEGGDVELLRWTEAGNIYYAMLHADDDDRSFDHTVDLPITDENGKIVVVKFTAL